MKPRACKACRQSLTHPPGAGRPREYCGPPCEKRYRAAVRKAERLELKALRAQVRPTAPEVPHG